MYIYIILGWFRLGLDYTPKPKVLQSDIIASRKACCCIFLLRSMIIMMLIRLLFVITFLCVLAVSYHHHKIQYQSSGYCSQQLHHSRLYAGPVSKTDSKDLPKLLSLTNLLVDLWTGVVYPPVLNDSIDDDDDDGVVLTLKDYNLNRNDVKGFIDHFQTCKDCAADNAFLMATTDDDNNDALKLANVKFSLLSEDEDEYDSLGDSFDSELFNNPDNIAPDEFDIDLTKSIFPIEQDDNVILRDTMKWVEKIIANFGVCPFTIDAKRAGIPVGGVRYHVSRATTPDEAFLRYWEEVKLLFSVSEKEISTVLLVFPEISLFGNFDLFESYCESLSDSLCSSSMCYESEIQLVFFHPKYQFRDGQARTGDDMGAANFARRSPWPMINILRTPQVRAAQKGIPTGIVYKQNEERLTSIGTKVLEDMLYKRDWTAIPTIREKAIKIADANDEYVSGANANINNKNLIAVTNKESKKPLNIKKEKKVANLASCDDKMSVDDILKFANDIDEWMSNDEN